MCTSRTGPGGATGPTRTVSPGAVEPGMRHGMSGTAARSGVPMAAPSDPARANVVLVLEVPDADLARKVLESRGVSFLAETYRPPWGGSRFFCVDPDGYLVEIEQPG